MKEACKKKGIKEIRPLFWGGDQKTEEKLWENVAPVGVAPKNSKVLIYGKNGTGEEMIRHSK